MYTGLYYVLVWRGTLCAPGRASLKCTYDEMYYYYYPEIRGTRYQVYSTVYLVHVYIYKYILYVLGVVSFGRGA